jgi:hypothetical protein
MMPRPGACDTPTTNFDRCEYTVEKGSGFAAPLQPAELPIGAIEPVVEAETARTFGAAHAGRQIDAINLNLNLNLRVKIEACLRHSQLPLH